MEIEILGVMKNARGPGQDMVLGRLHGAKPEYTGVVAGMSGSPVYIDGRLLGALSFRIGQFSKEPICGITPIADMMQVLDAGSSGASNSHPGGPSNTRPGGPPETQPSAQADDNAPRSTDREIAPIETPLVFGGFSQEAVDRFGDRFRALGLSPLAGLGGSDSSAVQPEPIVPGSAVSAILVRGDLSMAGTCTVTYVDPKHLLACGHPITQFGPVAMPMTKATVLATLPSPLNAFKIVETTQTIGAFTQDRNAAILGQFGLQARMIPVKITIASASGSKDVHFEVLDNRALTPSAMLVSVYQSLQQTNQAAAETGYRLSGDLEIQGQPSVKLKGVIGPNEQNSAAINTALYIDDRFGRIYANSAEQPVVDGLTLLAEAIADGHAATLERARLSRNEVHAGDTIFVDALIHPFRAPSTRVRIPVTIPVGTAPGDLRLVIGDAATADRLTLPSNGAQSRPVALRDTIDQMNRAHLDDRLYVFLLVHDAQSVLEGGTLGQVPLSMANVLNAERAEPGIQLTGETAAEVGTLAAGHAIAGSQVLNLRVF